MNPTIVLVHGGFVDGSGWRGVYDALTGDGYPVRIVQNPTKSLADDAAITRDVLDDVAGPVVLVGHSYGGAVITEAGNHDNVSALVYVTAFAPDQGESVNSLLATFPADGPSRPSSRRSAATCSWTGPNSPTPSPATWPRPKPPSCATRRSRGAWTRSAALSPKQPGEPSRAGTCTSPKTG